MATKEGADIKRPLISIRNISLSYGNFQALTDVSVDFHQGEMVGLVGDNGAGQDHFDSHHLRHHASHLWRSLL